MQIVINVNELNTSMSEWNKFKDILLKDLLNEYKRFIVESAMKNTSPDQQHIVEEEISRNFFDAYGLLGLKSTKQQERVQERTQEPVRQPRRQQEEEREYPENAERYEPPRKPSKNYLDI